MKFVDEAIVHAHAGKGGHGCLSFRREAHAPQGGPDGGDGGDGGSIYLQADAHVNTLSEYRYKRSLKAQNGQPGSGRLRRGKSGEDLVAMVPVGTTVFDADTDELIGDLTVVGQQICVAKGGFHGLGNTRYKSSTNRTPRQTTQGTLGEDRRLRMELKLLADVGLLGMPNAGKSTLISKISNATPKIADYPFTTLHPGLGVVDVDEWNSFVVADIPGLIEGASEGVGLGIRFLKHLTRTKLLLHLVDIASDNVENTVISVQAILNELAQHSDELIDKPRWLVINKLDLLGEEEASERCEQLISGLDWKGPVFKISALNKEGLKPLCYKVMEYLSPEE